MTKKSFVKIDGLQLTVRVKPEPSPGCFTVEVDAGTGHKTFSGCRRSHNTAIVEGQVLRAEQTGTGTSIVSSQSRVPISIKDRPSASAAGLRLTNKPKRAGICAPLPGQVVAVLVRESSRVEAGEHLVVIEAMKMQNPVIAERAGTVQKLYVKQGDSVQSGDQLLEMSREE